MISLTWPQVLAWRMRRQFLDRPAQHGPVEVVRRLAGVQAQVATSAELAIAVRQARPDRDAVRQALWEDGTLVKTWAMRGTLHLLPADQAGAYLSLVASARPWERPAWQRAFGATPSDLEAIATAAAEALDGGKELTRDELAAAIVDRTRSDHLAALLGSGWGTLLKPLACWGVLCHGRPRGSRVTFRRPDGWLAGWCGIPSSEEAAPVVIRAYLGAHGPASMTAFNAWLTRGSLSVKALRHWFQLLADELTTVDVEGTPMFVAAEHVDELMAQPPRELVCLLPGFDQYLLAAGTGTAEVVPPDHRGEVSRTAGWIAPVVISGGRVAGVWEANRGAISVTLFEAVPKTALAEAIVRMETLLALVATPGEQ